MYAFLRPFLFNTDPEKAHEITLSLLEKSQKLGLLGFLYGKQELTTECMGLTFANPVGLAAGLDKNGEYILTNNTDSYIIHDVDTLVSTAKSIIDDYKIQYKNK